MHKLQFYQQVILVIVMLSKPSSKQPSPDTYNMLVHNLLTKSWISIAFFALQLNHANQPDHNGIWCIVNGTGQNWYGAIAWLEPSSNSYLLNFDHKSYTKCKSHFRNCFWCVNMLGVRAALHSNYSET